MPIIFADDTNIFIKGNSILATMQILNDELVKIVNWLNANKLSLNISKTHYIIFQSQKRGLRNSIDLRLNNSNIEQVYSTKFIGVVLDSNLKWDKHIQMVKNKVAKGLGILCKAKKTINRNILVTLYYSIIYPHYIYCIEVWGNSAQVYITPLLRMQKKIVRMITSSPYRAESHPIFKELKLLRLSQIYSYAVIILMYKFINVKLPCLFDNMFQMKNYTDQRTRQSNKLRVPICRTGIYGKTFRFQGVKHWNHIVDKIDYHCSIHTYKKKLKNYLQENDLL
jgi:hypothetical protein